ncbi:MAG: aminotransferase class IV [Calditrichaeota bacterium]|nr:aminotransferase class IV [Calditrichota bacterium]
MAGEITVMTESIVYLNTQYVDSSKAMISAFDRGFLYGDGVYETIRAVNGHLFHFNDHFERLKQSADAMNIELPFSVDACQSILLKLIDLNKLDHAYLRLTISRGVGLVGFNQAIGHSSTVLIVAKAFIALDPLFYKNGIEIITAKTRRNAPEAVNPAIKSISNLNSLLGRIEAQNAGKLEVIMLNNKGFVCEGSASNIFWVKDQTVYTPDQSTGLLEGVTRKQVIKLCDQIPSLSLKSGAYPIEDCYAADELFITSTSLEVMPVIKLDDKKINSGEVGPVSIQLLTAFRKLYERDAA